jgi:hypothetical protein
MVRREQSDNRDAVLQYMPVSDTETGWFVVRESCYPFYEPSYTELSHGCSQEVQSFKRW